MEWNQVTALCAVIGVMGTAFLFVTRSIVREELKKLNDTFVSREADILKHSAIADKFSDIYRRFANMEIKFGQIDKHFDYLKDEYDRDDSE